MAGAGRGFTVELEDGQGRGGSLRWSRRAGQEQGRGMVGV